MFEDIGEILRRLRKRRGLTQAALAEKAGYDYSSVSRWESGSSSPSIARFNRMLEIMEVSFPELIREISIEQGREPPTFSADYLTDPDELVAAQALLIAEEGLDVGEWLEELVAATKRYRRAYLWAERHKARRKAEGRDEPDDEEDDEAKGEADGETAEAGDPAALAETPADDDSEDD